MDRITLGFFGHPLKKVWDITRIHICLEIHGRNRNEKLYHNYKKRRDTTLRSSQIIYWLKICVVVDNRRKCQKMMFKDSTVAIDACITPSNNGLADSLKCTGNLLDIRSITEFLHLYQYWNPQVLRTQLFSVLSKN